MRILATLIAFCGLVFCAGCQSPSVHIEAPSDTLSTPVYSPIPASMTDSPSQEGDATPMTPSDSTPAASGVEPLVELAKKDLAKRLSISVVEIDLVEDRAVVWRDASLGCPKPGIDHIQVETPGFNVILKTGGKTYTYHTNEKNRVILCMTR